LKLEPRCRLVDWLCHKRVSDGAGSSDNASFCRFLSFFLLLNCCKINDMDSERQMQKKIVKLKLHDKQNDFAYWQSQSYEARLSQLEQIRQEYHQWKYNAEPRLQRVYKVITLNTNKI